MVDLVVLVPGITGSALHGPTGPVWDLSVAAFAAGLKDPTGALAALALPPGLREEVPESPGALRPVGLITGWHLWPGLWAGSGYGRLLATVRRAAPQPGRVVAFPYDWRLANQVNARRLLGVIEPALAQLRATTGDDNAKVIFICHSMGGLIARYCIEVLGARTITRRLVTLGTPYSGSVKAVRALLGTGFGRIGETLRTTVRTFPSVCQLLPTYRCVATNDTPVRLDQLDIEDLDQEMLDIGRRFHAEIADALRRNGASPYETYAFGGKRQPTLQSVRVAGRTPTYSNEPPASVDDDNRGDGTVAHFSAVAPEHGNTAAGTFVAARHSALQKHTAMLDLVLDKVRGVDLGAFLAPPTELALDVPDIVPAGRPLQVRVAADRVDLLVSARLIDADGTPVGGGTSLRPDGHGDYHGELTPPCAGTWKVEAATVAETPPSTIEDLVTVVA